jgi:hypothetical protein
MTVEMRKFRQWRVQSFRSSRISCRQDLFRIYKATGTNLLPDLEISRIDLASEMGPSAPFVLAITVE